MQNVMESEQFFVQEDPEVENVTPKIASVSSYGRQYQRRLDAACF
jgi:hypothetical protein